MSESKSLFESLLRRRVFQFVGMYVAATWLVIELGDWITERFGLPADLTSYVFVAMLALLPSVVVFAYGHGAPGRDEWSRFERFFIPGNVVLAALALLLVDPDVQAEAATQTVQIADETGAVREYEVPRQGYHRELVGFFWTNASGDVDLDWLSYGLPLMMAHDIDRVTPTVTVVTPFTPDFTRDRLRRQAGGSLVDISRGLAVQVARERLSKVLVLGSFDIDGDGYRLTATVVDADNGEVIGRQEITAADWIDGVDRISAGVLDLLEIKVADDKNDDPLRQHFSESIDAVRHFTLGKIATNLENDYPTGIAEYAAAVSLDPRFAEARGSLSVSYYLSGDIESARTEASLALRDGYRLSDASKFSLKAQRYIYDADFERGLRVMDIWTEVQPNSTRALAGQAQLLRLRGGEEALDKAQAAYDRLLELNPANISVYLDKSEVEMQRGAYDVAAGLLQKYLEVDPDSAEARLRLASVYQADGDLDRAQEVLEYAAVLFDEPVAPGLALVRLQARRGEFGAAVEHLDELLEDAVTPQQRLQLLSARMEILTAQGRIREAIETQSAANELARGLIPPMLRLFSVEGQKTNLLALVGETEKALAIADGIADDLQPPLSDYMNFSYTNIYWLADDREAFRAWAAKSLALENDLPAPMQPFIRFEQARIAIWDGHEGDAIEMADEISGLIGASFVQLIEGDLSVFSLYTGLARLYLDAGALDKAEAELERVLRVYPGNPHAKLVLGRTLQARGDIAGALELTREAVDAYQAADEGFIYRREAEAMLDELLALGEA